tara:strand:+ start:140 stop:625 length:486 start_codon:yes stop_codon:yes gene_type:complete
MMMMIEIIMMIAALAFMVNSVKIKIAPTKNWHHGPLYEAMTVDKEYDAEVATNQEDYEKEQKVFALIPDSLEYLLKNGEYVITRFKATAKVVKEWANGDGGWICSGFRGFTGTKVWAVYESNGDLVDASWGGEQAEDFGSCMGNVSSDEWSAFQEWAIFSR